jgi:hypothetical protein
MNSSGEVVITFPKDLKKPPQMTLNDNDYYLTQLTITPNVAPLLGENPADAELLLEFTSSTNDKSLVLCFPLVSKTSSKITCIDNLILFKLAEKENPITFKCDLNELIRESHSWWGFNKNQPLVGKWNQQTQIIRIKQSLIIKTEMKKYNKPDSVILGERSSTEYKYVLLYCSLDLPKNAKQENQTETIKILPFFLPNIEGLDNIEKEKVDEKEEVDDEYLNCEPIDIGAELVPTLQIPYNSNISENVSIGIISQSTISIFIVCILMFSAIFALPKIYEGLLDKNPQTEQVYKITTLEYVLSTLLILIFLGIILDGLHKNSNIQVTLGMYLFVVLIVMIGAKSIVKMFNEKLQPDNDYDFFKNMGELFGGNNSKIIAGYFLGCAAVFVAIFVPVQLLTDANFSGIFWGFDCWSIPLFFAIVFFFASKNKFALPNRTASNATTVSATTRSSTQ